MTLLEWAEGEKLTDREVAALMTEWLAAQGSEETVSVQAVQKYRTGRVPKADRMRAINAVTGGAVQANDFYDLPAVSQ